MNAPARAVELVDPKVELIPLTAITPSETHIQELRRARFSKEGLTELASSIKNLGGVLQPIVVRPLSALRGLAKFEIVAGERRWLATKQAGIAHIQASVRALTDEQVLEVQLVENLQREGLHELEEAEGYEELMKLKGINADQVALMVGKSRSYVYARTKLLALCPEARKGFYAGELDASTALLLARIPHHDLQLKALGDIKEHRGYGECTNYRDTAEFIQQNYMLQLKAAPFDLKDVTLHAKAGACTTCPKRTGNQRDLFGDVKSADVCTDPKCFAEKRELAEKRTIDEYKAKGVEVLVGDAARRVLPWGDGNASGGYHLLGEQCWDDPKHRKFADLVDDKDVKLVQSPHSGKMLKVVHNSAVTTALKGKGVTTERQKIAKLPDQAVVEGRLLKAVHDKFNGELTKPLLQILVLELARTCDDCSSDPEVLDEHLTKVWGLKDSDLTTGGYGNEKLVKAVADFDFRKLARLAVVLLSYVDTDGRLGAVCDVLKIDRKKIEKQVAEEAKAAAKAAKPKTDEKPAAKVKAKGKKK